MRRDGICGDFVRGRRIPCHFIQYEKYIREAVRREDEYDPAGGGNTFSVREDGEYLLFQDRIENGLMSGAVKG